MTTILIIDDEPAIRRLVSAIVERGGYTPVAAGTARDALGLLARGGIDAAIVDLGLPDRDGIELIAAMRGRSAMPILVLTARDATEEKVAALDLGADDYITKPFDGDELLARLRSALRRAGRPVPTDGPLQHGTISIDLGRHQVTRDGAPIALTPREFAVLQVLAEAGGRLVTHPDLLRRVWGQAHVEDVDYLRVVVRALRLKLEADPSAPTLIRNEPGIGYRLADA